MELKQLKPEVGKQVIEENYIFMQVLLKIPKEYKNNVELMSLVNINELNYGNIICSCELTDCIEMTDEFIEKNKEKIKMNIYLSIC